MAIEIIKRGVWYYDDKIIKPIVILKQDFDFYHDEGFDDNPPSLNSNGESFYVIFDDYTDIRYANRSRTCLSLDEAIELAENKVGKIKWE